MIKKRHLVVASAFVAMVASSSAWAQQYARPVGTPNDGGWTIVGSPAPATHHEAVDEISADHINADDSDYISTTTGTTIEFLLDGLTDPGDNTNHILRFRCKSEGSKGAERCDVALVDATFGVIASTNNNSASRGAFDIFQLAIADTDAANITSYSNLSVHITATVAAGESVQISWVELEVPASASTAPFVTTIAEAGVTDIQATVGGNVTSDGNDTLTEVGVYYSTSAGFTPPGEGTRLIDPDPPQPVVGNFTLDLTGLLAGTTYYYQAFAANGIGETIADLPQEQFTTKDTPVMLATPTVTIDSPTSATLGGTMTSNGFDPTGVSDCGIEWGDTSGGPYTQVSAGVCTENNAFFAPQLVDLTTGQDYFFRSYATNSVDTGYSNERSFRPVDTPSVTGTIDDLLTTETTAVLGGDITDTGGDTVTAVGIIWDTDSDPISNDNGADVTMVVPDPVSDPFSQTVTGLPAGTPLWFVAYASNGAGVGYSAVVPFTTDPGAPTMDPTPTVTDVDVDRATLGGKMTSDGGGAISDCGVELSTDPGGPYGPPQSAGVCAENVAFSTQVTGLTTGLTYYFRAYAINGQGTDYSNELSFVPQGLPVVVSSPEANPTFNSADLGGNVTNDGGSTVTERGIVWDLNPAPESQGTKTIVPMGSGTGLFGPQTVSLPPASTIYFEAYATNAAGTAYSNDDRSFPTGTEPSLQASSAVFSSVAGTSVRITWTRGNGDGVIVVLRESGTLLADPQDNVDYTYNIDYTLATEIPGTQNFVVYKGAATSAWVTGLTKSTDYSVAIYEYAGSGASTDYRQTLPAEASDTTKDYASHNYDYRIDCTQCHGGHFGVIPRGTDQEDKCVTCHKPGQAAENKLEFKNHLTPQRNPAIDDVDCGMCHELHNITGTLTGNTTRSVNTITPGEAYNKSFLRANVGKYVDPNYQSDKEAWPKAFLHDDTPKREDPHPDAPQPASTPERAVEGGDATTSRGYCQACHTMTAYHRNNPATGASTPSDYEKAGFMQCHDGGDENIACAEEVQCGECHEHNNSFQGVNNNLPCENCHDSGQGARPIITTMFDLGTSLSSHIPNGTPTKPDCVVCHGDHSHDGTVWGYDVDDGVTRWGTAAYPTTTTGEGEKFEPHCLSCHDSNGAASLPADGGLPTAGQTQNSPFINSNQPPIIDLTLWSNSSHDRPSGTFPGSPVSCVGNGANGCHGSGHGSDELSLLAPIPTTDTEISAKSSLVCTQCHQPGGVSSKHARNDFEPAVLPLVESNWQTTADSGAKVNRRHDIFDADLTYSGPGTALTCADCHSPHSDNAANPVANPDTGNALQPYAPATWATQADIDANDVGEDPTFGATGPDTIEFCLACHDGAGGTAQAGSAVLSPGLLDIGLEYATDFHGAGFGGTGGNGFLKPPYLVDTKYAPLQCTQCHGAHGSENIFNLRSTITVGAGTASETIMSTGGPWGSKGDMKNVIGTTYTLETANDGVSQDNMQWGAWCSFCHNMDSHSLDETKTCNGGHKHGGGKM